MMLVTCNLTTNLFYSHFSGITPVRRHQNSQLFWLFT